MYKIHQHIHSFFKLECIVMLKTILTATYAS